ncbi:hypothetical protein AAC387_Pa03g1975 [Persea americana]
MAGIPSNKHNRDRTLEFQGFLNDLQDWDHYLEKDKKLKGQAHEEKKVYGYFRNSDAVSGISSVLSTEEAVPDAASEKELGNEYYKQKKYKQAIECYSRSIALSPTAVAFANRAMAYIKIKKFEEAENDCTEALNLDDRYIKAYSRRATARKELGKLKASMEDADFAVRLDPNNQELRKQYTEVKALCDKEIRGKTSGAVKTSIQGIQELGSSKMKATAKDRDSKDGDGKIPSKSPNLMKEIEIRTTTGNRREDQQLDGSLGGATPDSNVGNSKNSNVGNRKQQLKASVQELASQAAARAMAAAAKNITTPQSAYQFEVSWRALSDDPVLQARLLKTIPPTTLPQLFKNALSAPILIDIIKCVATFFMEETELAVTILYNLSRVSRFDMIILCLSAGDKADLCKIWDEVFSSVVVPAHQAEMLAKLRPKYCPGRWQMHGFEQ